jgi:hypothetical protein
VATAMPGPWAKGESPGVAMHQEASSGACGRQLAERCEDLS